MKKETRQFNFEIRAEREENNGVLTGRPIVYDSRTDIGWFDEIIERGALIGTDLTDVRFLINHDISRIPLARSRRNNGNSTMQLDIDEEGLAIRVQLDVENNAEAKSLYSAVERGDISGMSFMFFVDEDNEKWEDLDSEHPLRRIQKIDSVLEVSAVTFPAYSETSIEVAKRDKAALDSARLALDRARERSKSQKDGINELDLWKARNKNIF